MNKLECHMRGEKVKAKSNSFENAQVGSFVTSKIIIYQG